MAFYKCNTNTDILPENFTVQIPIALGYYSRSTTGTTGAGVIFCGNINASTGAVTAQAAQTGTIEIGNATYHWKAERTDGGYQRFETNSNRGNATGWITVSFTRM